MYVQGIMHGSVVQPQVVIGDQIAPLLGFADAPGYPGYSQVNVQIPSGLGANPAAVVQLAWLGRWSNTVTIAVQ